MPRLLHVSAPQHRAARVARARGARAWSSVACGRGGVCGRRVQLRQRPREGFTVEPAAVAEAAPAAAAPAAAAPALRAMERSHTHTKHAPPHANTTLDAPVPQTQAGHPQVPRGAEDPREGGAPQLIRPSADAPPWRPAPRAARPGAAPRGASLTYVCRGSKGCIKTRGARHRATPSPCFGRGRTPAAV